MLRIRSALGFFLFTAGMGLGACGSDSDKEKLKAAKLAEGCTLNSNCENPLVCTFERCHRECEEDRDCAGEERCVQGASGRVCQLSIETSCTSNAQCKGAQTCGVDKECRDKCDDTSDCGPGQVCAVSKECASSDPTKDIVDPQGNIQQDPFGGTGGTGGAGGTSGNGGVGGTGGTGGTGGGSSGNGGVGGTGGGSSGNGGTAGSGGTAGTGGAAGTSGSGGTGGAIQCPAGLGNCDSNPGDCETSLALITSCGGCNITCDASHATVRCNATTYTCEIDTAGGGCNAGWANCDNNAVTGCEAELAKDKNNCGTCGKSCGGGECASSQCRAAVVMDPAGNQSHYSVRGFLAGSTVYYTYNSGGIVARSVTLPPTTPASEGTVIHSQAAPPAIGPTLADPGTGFLYFAGTSSIVKKRLDGTQGIGEVLTTVAQPANLTMNATALFFSAYSGGYNIYTGVKSASSAAAAPIISGRGNIYELFAAGTRLYWTENVSGVHHVFTALQSGGPVTSLDETIGNGSYVDFATDGTYVYWNQYTGSAKIQRVAIATSTKPDVHAVAQLLYYPTEGLAVDGTYVYFANTQFLIQRTLKDGSGTPQTITQLNGGVPYWYGLFAVDTQYLYGVGNYGEILRVAKTP